MWANAVRALMPFGVAFAAAAVVAGQATPPQQPTFRAGTNLVQVDVIVRAPNGGPAGDLTADDFELFDDNVAVPITAFKFIDLSKAEARDRYPVRTGDDEEREAARDDTRLIAILLDDYHIARFGPNRVVPALVSFVEHLPPTDLVGVFYPLDSPKDVRLTYDRQASIHAIRKLEGRWHDYAPKHPVEEEHLRYQRAIERLRTQVVLTGAVSLATHLGELKIGRKSIVLISEGFTPAGYDSGIQSFYDDVQDVTAAANRNNVSIYAVDPRGLTVESSGFGAEILRTISDETGGRPIVGRNDFLPALAEIVHETSAYYLLGFVSTHPADGKFHRLSVRTKRRMNVTARAGYWALTEAEVAASQSRPAEVPRPITAALNQLAEALRPAGDDARHVQHADRTAAAPRMLLDTPIVGVVRGRFPFEPAARPEFTRTQRISIRAAIASGIPLPTMSARLLDRHGNKLADLPVTITDGACEVPIALGSLGVGDYVVQLAASRGEETAEQYVALRVSR